MAKKPKSTKKVQVEKAGQVVTDSLAGATRFVSANSMQFMVILLLIGSFFIGRLTAQVEYLKSGGSVTTQVPAAIDPNTQQPVRPTISLDQVKAVFKEDVIKIGDPNKSKLTVLEISDPSCPFCHIASGTNPEINKENARFTLVSDGGTYVAPVAEIKKLVSAGKAAYAWIYTPGSGGGEVAAKAIYCAHEKGRFWQAHETVFTARGMEVIREVGNDTSKADKMVDLLKGVVDAKFLQSCITSGKYDDVLTENAQIAASLGASATPSFFFNETFFEGADNYTNMESVVNEALK
jgi:protein-disulfide isomerase